MQAHHHVLSVIDRDDEMRDEAIDDVIHVQRDVLHQVAMESLQHLTFLGIHGDGSSERTQDTS